MGAQRGKVTNEPSNYFAFGKQSAKDVEAGTFFFTRHMSGTGYEQQSNVDSIREGGDGQEISLRYRTLVKGDGALNSLGRQSITARLFHGVLGSDSIATAGIASLARHTAVPVSSLPYFTIEQAHADNIERQSNGVWTEVTVTGEAGQPWKIAAAFTAAGTMTFRDIASAMTPTRESGRPVFYPGGSYAFDGAGSYAADITKWSVKVTRGVDDTIQTTSLNRDDVLPLTLEVECDATLKYTSRDFYQKVQYNSGSSIPQSLPTGQISLVQYSQVGTLGASALSQIVIPLLEWTDAKVNKLDPDGKTVYMDVIGQSIKNSTYAIYAINDNTDLTTY